MKSGLKRLAHFSKEFIMGNLVRKEPVYIPQLTGDLLQGRTALITGATAGIGFAIADAFLRNGADVVVAGRDSSRIDNAIERLKIAHSGKGAIDGFVLDIGGSREDVERHFRAIEKTHPSLDILVNNAGILKGDSFGNLSEVDFDEVMSVNLRGPALLSQVFASKLIAQRRGGNILNIASSSSLRPAVSPYTMSKWGLRGLTLGMAKTLIKYGIVVNGLAPGPTATSMLQGKRQEFFLEHDTVPAARYAAPEEIANMSVVLTSDLGKMIVGDIVYMTGGSGVLTYDDGPYSFVI